MIFQSKWYQSKWSFSPNDISLNDFSPNDLPVQMIFQSKWYQSKWLQSKWFPSPNDLSPIDPSPINPSLNDSGPRPISLALVSMPLNWKTNNMSCKPHSKYLPTVPKLNEERSVFEGGCRFSCNRLWLSLSWEKELAAKTSLPEYFSLLLTPNTFHILHPHYQRYLCLSV